MSDNHSSTDPYIGICPHCNSDDLWITLDEREWDQPLTYYSCGACGESFKNPIFCSPALAARLRRFETLPDDETVMITPAGLDALLGTEAA